MKYFLILVFFSIYKVSICEEYIIEHQMSFDEKIFTLKDGSIFSIINASGVWKDSNADFGPVKCRGVREANKNKKLLNLNVVCEQINSIGDKLWLRAIRDTDVDGGVGIWKVLDGTGKFTVYKDYECAYAVSFASNVYYVKANCKNK